MNRKHVPSSSTDRDFQHRILIVRGQRVILDADLAAIYGVATKRLNEQVKRNRRRFPADFVFRLTPQEFKGLRSQRMPQVTPNQIVTKNRSHFATGSSAHRDPRSLPLAFTENGAVMAANVLNSPEAVRLSVFVVRTFIRMREILGSTEQLAVELKRIEAALTSRLDGHEVAIVEVLQRIKALLDPPPAPRVPEKTMGFHAAMKKPRSCDRG